jgi:hypothetical protein
MFTNEQRQYLEDVLGLNSAGYALAGTAPGPAHHPLLVLTYLLNDEERALLAKILGSIRLAGYHHLEEEKISLAEFPEGHTADHVLAFIDYPPGRHQFGEGGWTVLPPVSSMTGANAEVVARKKEAWALLQQFAKERA